MFYEKLALEVNAVAAGLKAVKPATLRGKSGLEQRFAFVATDGNKNYAFDIYPEVSEAEVLKTYVKKLDTGAEAQIVYLKGRPTVEASELAANYGIGVVSPGKVVDFFSRMVLSQPEAEVALRALV